MNKKKIIGCSLLILLAILSISGVYYFKKEKKKDNKIKSNKSLAIIINSSGTETSSDSIPIGSYILNKEKTYCENNGKVISYDNEKGSVSFSFIGSDKCHLYFDYNDTTSPVFKNVTYLNNTFNATLYDDSKVVGYQITNSFNEPTSYIDVTDNKLSLTLQDNKNYYIWIKDASNNVKYYYQNTSTSKISLKNYIVNRYTNQNEIKERTNFKEVYQDKNDSLFKTTESTDNKTVYYYAGDTQNNWVKFGKNSLWFACAHSVDTSDSIVYQVYQFYFNDTGCDDGDKVLSTSFNTFSNIYWRIIRSDEDGNLRLLYNGLSPNSGDTIIASSPFDYVDRATWINHYTDGYLSSYTRDIVDSWYEFNLKNDYEKFLNTNSEYCVSTNHSYDEYSYEYTILSNGEATYKCDTSQSDFKNISSSHGIMNATEATFAGLLLDENSSDQYKIYFNLNKYSEPMILQSKWVLASSAFELYNGYNERYIFYIGGYKEYGSLRYGVHYDLYGIRPVISLASCANYSSGDGSPDSPYEIDLSSCS